MSFSKIAMVYDRFNDLSAYEFWLDFTMHARSFPPHRVLDLACGTGWFTQLLAPFVGQIDGVDIDSAMLEIAQRELDEIADNVHFFQGDMTALEVNTGSYDMVTCYLDSLCFLSEWEQVSKSFQEAYRVLKSGGVYLFDVWTVNQINALDGFSYSDYDEEAALFWDSFKQPDSITIYHQLTVFQKESDSSKYVRHDVELTETTYPLDQYLNALTDVGFSDIEVYDETGSKAIENAPNERWFFRCYKR